MEIVAAGRTAVGPWGINAFSLKIKPENGNSENKKALMPSVLNLVGPWPEQLRGIPRSECCS